MLSLTELQARELSGAILAGQVDYHELLVLGRFIYEKHADTLRRQVECAGPWQAKRVLEALRHLPGCPSC